MFESYISFELSLGNIERCRLIYEKYVHFRPQHAPVWVKFSEFEVSLGETERAYAILELGTKQELEMPEMVWKGWINISTELGDYEKVREVYQNLLDLTTHTKVWLSFAKFEEDIENIKGASQIFVQAYSYFKENNNNAERLVVLEKWIELAEKHIPDKVDELKKKLPTKVVKRRRIEQLEGEEDKWEEYYDFVFPEDKEEKKNLKIVEMAKKWADSKN